MPKKSQESSTLVLLQPGADFAPGASTSPASVRRGPLMNKRTSGRQDFHPGRKNLPAGDQRFKLWNLKAVGISQYFDAVFTFAYGIPSSGSQTAGSHKAHGQSPAATDFPSNSIHGGTNRHIDFRPIRRRRPGVEALTMAWFMHDFGLRL
jgi:hypothetical protein